ncbi:MAG: Asp-tRNA(Asn)/Glu-tRNA(Gln) amidotransferase subunit GatB [Planctomycetota bacterium]
MNDYETVVGLEVHVQPATQTKMFCPATCAFGREPNTQVDGYSMGLPGTLPVINRHAVELAVQAALAFDCQLHPHSKFDRKHYFYPDLPKGYQISQYDQPYCTGGGVAIDCAAGTRRLIPLTRIHLEEDAGKLVHQEGGRYSEVDLNRAGTPLIEIVSEPDIRSGAEAYAYIYELRRVLRYCGVSDCEMQEGSLRCDANISVRPRGSTEMGTKVEIKNLNSMRAVEAAIEHEAQLQVALHRAGRYASAVVQETKLWDPDARVTRSMRGKEGAADYRYFPDPDLPPLHIDSVTIERLRGELPELPRSREERFIAMGLSDTVARELTAERAIAELFEAVVATGVSAKAAANWTREEALRLVAAEPALLAAPLREPFVATLGALVALVEAGKVARVVAKGECDALFAAIDRVAPVALVVEDHFAERGMIQEQDDDALAAWVAEVLRDNPKVVADIQAGNAKAIGRLIGCTMKLSGGKADPKAVQEQIRAQLAEQ